MLMRLISILQSKRTLRQALPVPVRLFRVTLRRTAMNLAMPHRHDAQPIMQRLKGRKGDVSSAISLVIVVMVIIKVMMTLMMMDLLVMCHQKMIT